MDDAVTAGFPLLDAGETGPFVVEEFSGSMVLQVKLEKNEPISGLAFRPPPGQPQWCRTV